MPISTSKCAAGALVLLFAGCGGSGPTTVQPSTLDSGLSPSRPLTAAEVSLASRICETQLANGYWNFEHPWYEPINPADPGVQNIVGVTADGLLGAYARDRADGSIDDVGFVPMCVNDAKNALLALCDSFVANPAGPRPSLSNFVFLGRYRDIVGMAPGEEVRARNALMLRIAQDDTNNGTDPTVIVDGWLNLIATARAGTPGLIGWEAAFMVKVCLLWALPPTDRTYAVNFVKSRPIDTTIDYGTLSAAHALEVLNMVGVEDVTLNAQLRVAIEARARGDGSYPDVSDGTGPGYQSTAYVLMAYKQIDAAQVPATQAWLTSEIHANGALWDPATDIENFEVNGEVLLALTK